MSYTYKAPKIPEPEKPQDPVINMVELQQATDLQKNQRGMLSTYLQGSTQRRSSLSDYLSGQKQSTLGSSVL